MATSPTDHDMPQAPDMRSDLDARRRAARRTALLVAALALAVYVMFMLTGAIGP